MRGVSRERRLVVQRCCVHLLAPLVLAGCAGGSDAQLAQIKALETRSAAVEQATEAPLAGSYTLPQLIARARQRAPEVMRAELRGVLDQVEFDQVASSGAPRVGVDADYGRAAFIRRDEPSSGLRIAPSLTWDVVRSFHASRIERLRGRSEEAARLQRSIANRQVDVEVVRRYVELEAARAVAELERARADVAKRRARLASLQRAAMADAPDEEERTAADTAQRLRSALGRLRIAEIRLERMCGLPDGATIAPLQTPAGLAEAAPLGDYVAAVLADAGGLELVGIRADLAGERARLVAKQRWTAFRFSADGGDVLRLLSASPFALIGWTYALIDQGDFNRQLVRARADALLARLDRSEEADRLIDTAGRVWLALLDAAAARRQAEEAARVTSLAHRVALAQAADSAAAADGLIQAELALAAATTDLRLRALDHMLASSQYRALAGQPAEGDS